MCGRFALTIPDLDFLAEMLEAEYDPEFRDLYKQSYNIGPQTLNPILFEVAGALKIIPARWGWEGFGGKLLINARSETAGEKKTFSEAFRERRCIIPASGFFEWLRDGKEKKPYWFFPSGNTIFLFGGMFEIAFDGERRFIVLTTEANPVVSPVHDRMPVILGQNKLHDWFFEPTPGLTRPVNEQEIRCYEVSTRVNSVKNNDPECIVPIKKQPSGNQPLLF